MAKITKRFIDALKATSRKTSREVVYWDDELRRFGVRVRPGGAVMTYICQYRTPGGRAGRTRKLLLGHVGVLTPEQARTAAKVALAAVGIGKDPADEKRAQRASPTVAELVEKYLREGPADKPDKKASSWAIDASNLRRHVVPLLGRRHARALIKRDLQQLQASITKGETKADRKSGKTRGRVRVRGGAGTAWRTTVVVASMLAWAVERGILEKNPAKDIRLNKPNKRERFLTDDEVLRLGDALAAVELDGENPKALAIIRLLLLSGSRRNEMESLRPEYVDFQRGAAFLPDGKSGMKTLPLGAPALEVLAANIVEGAEWVFPAVRGDGYYQGVAKVWRDVRAAAGLPGVRLHDLRHSFASGAVAGGGLAVLAGSDLRAREGVDHGALCTPAARSRARGGRPDVAAPGRLAPGQQGVGGYRREDQAPEIAPSARLALGRAKHRARTPARRADPLNGYPPDKQEKATQTVLEQAEVLSGAWTD